MSAIYMALWASKRQDGGYHREAGPPTAGTDTVQTEKHCEDIGQRQLRSDTILELHHDNMYPKEESAQLRTSNTTTVAKGWAVQNESHANSLFDAINTNFGIKKDSALLALHFLGSSFDEQLQPRVLDSEVPPKSSGLKRLERSPQTPLILEKKVAQLVSEDMNLSLGTENSSNEFPLLPPRSPPGPGPGPSFAISEFQPRSMLEMPHRQRSLDRAAQKVRILRLEIWNLRSKVHELRRDLRQKQTAKSAADNKYFHFVRTHGLGMSYHNQDISKEHKMITELFHDCEAARDEYGPLEDDCNILEDHLSSREFELQKLEDHVSSRENMLKAEGEDLPSQSEVSEPDEQYPASSTDNESEFGHESHPLVSKYLSMLGDVDILTERLDWRAEEKNSLEGEKESRQLVNLELPPDSQAWLDNFEIEENALLQKLEEAEKEAEVLKQQCFAKGLVDEAGNPTDFEQQEQQAFSTELASGLEKSDFVKFPLLLPEHGTKEFKFDESRPDPEDVAYSVGDHINQWLLHRLRSSPLDVDLLARVFESNFGRIVFAGDWELHVLSYWYQDGARKRNSYYRAASSIVALKAPISGTISQKSQSNNGDRHRGRIFFRGP